MTTINRRKPQKQVTALELSIVAEMKAAGFKYVENPSSMDHGFITAVKRGVLAVREFGKEYFEGYTTLGVTLKEIVYKLA